MPFTYLGLPLGTTRPSVQELMPLVCSLERRLSATLNMVSYGGKLLLLNSVITSLIIFAICTLRMPTKIIELLDKIRRKCLWIKKNDHGDKINSLASWEMVCRPKDSGGLGVLNLLIHGDALLLKYLHKFYNKWDTPWVQLIWDTYYTDQIPHASDPCGAFWWRDVIKLIPTYRGISKVSVGNGENVLFWKDMWREEILAASYPRALSYAKNEDLSVQQFLGITTLQEAFHLPLSPQAHAEMRQLQLEVSEVQLSNEIDKWTYVWNTNLFSAKQYYTFYFREIQAHESFGWIWKSKSTMKIKVFGWLLLSDRLNTRNMLNQRNYNIGDDHDCILCGLPIEETLEHLFFECHFSSDCWSHLGLSWHPGNSRLQNVSKAKEDWNRPLFMELFLLAAWSIWKERNNKHFRKIIPSKSSWLARLKADFSLLTHRVREEHKQYISIILASL